MPTAPTASTRALRPDGDLRQRREHAHRRTRRSRARPGSVWSSRSPTDSTSDRRAGWKTAPIAWQHGTVPRRNCGAIISKSKLQTVKLKPTARFSTICIHAGQEPDPSTGAIITPIFQTSTYVQEELGQHKGYEYARTQNPTRAALEANLAAIEGGHGGVRVRLGHGGDRRHHDAC